VGPDGQEHDTLAVIPDSSYAGVYQTVIDDCRANGAFDPTTMGSVPNVGLMAQKAEEYGSHDKTFEISDAGASRSSTARRQRCSCPTTSAPGDIWRACQTKDAPIRDWVKLAVTRARASAPRPCSGWTPPAPTTATSSPRSRPTWPTTTPTAWTSASCPPSRRPLLSIERIRRGEDTISVTGNVLRDYNTDLFPILELGTSAKMLSVVPLMNGGGLFETGAGGSAPKHVQQLTAENYLRWDSLGEFLALAESFRHEATNGNARAGVLGECLDRATERLLNEDKSPARRVGQIDNRGSHFWLARYWAQELAEQTQDTELAARFAEVSEQLTANAEAIDAELIAVQGSPADIGGYYRPRRRQGISGDAPVGDVQRHHRRDLSSDSRVRRRSAAPVASTGAALPSKAALSCLDS
jgi:isocitrate dehydrogenase